MNQDYRLFNGGLINRERPLAFQFNGRDYLGFEGDTLASALLANGVHRVARSFKYHRPRGIFSAGSEEPNALVQLESGAYTQPNLRATQVELYAGLTASSQNCWPSVDFDLHAINGLFSRIMPAGFYYKTFMWPQHMWMTYERIIRQAAGMGQAPREPDPDVYDKMHAHCDVLVVGAGAAGLAAALTAARSGARVILADEQAQPGGSLLSRRIQLDDAPASEWAAAAIGELESLPEVRVLRRTTVTGYFDHNYLIAAERLTDHLPPGGNPGRPRQRLWKIRSAQVVLATGAHERPLVFRNNDRPGVMLAGAAQTYVNRYAVRPGYKAVVFCNNDSGWEAALDLSDAGIQVSLVEIRDQASAALLEQARRRDLQVYFNHVVVAAHGRRQVRQVAIAQLNAGADGLNGGSQRIDCDLVCLAGGWNPAVHLFSQSRGKVVYDEQRSCFVPGQSVQAERSAGAANGTFDLAFAFAEGREAGKAAAAAAGFRKRGKSVAPKVDSSAAGTGIMPLWLVPGARGQSPNKSFVDIQNDVTAADLGLAVREGYRSVEHAKRYTTTGMGTDQGKTSNVNALAIIAGHTGAGIPATGTTTFRPPYTPISFGALAGRDIGALMDPLRRTPMYEWHLAHGARWEDVGQWKRAWYYPKAGESLRAATSRECLATRNAIGILDASTLGKIDIRGPDAAQFLNRIYTNGWKSLKTGCARYGLMCGEDGFIFDDGVTLRLAEDRFLMHTTTGNAARVLGWLEVWLQTEWPDLRVYCNSVTEQWATAAISGPYARRLLSELCADVDLSKEAFPFMTCRNGHVAGIPARIVRVSFTGEVSFEINVAADYGLALWSQLMLSGEKYGITPFGTETMHILRAEKGFIIAGQETDGTAMPADVGLGRMVSGAKDFIGKRSMSRPDSQRGDRHQLVGLLTENPREVLPEGAQIVAAVHAQPPMPMIGHVTSSYWSANLGHSIALAMLERGTERHGEQVVLPLEHRQVRATVRDPRFYDPNGERMNG